MQNEDATCAAVYPRPMCAALPGRNGKPLPPAAQRRMIHSATEYITIPGMLSICTAGGARRAECVPGWLGQASGVSQLLSRHEADELAIGCVAFGRPGGGLDQTDPARPVGVFDLGMFDGLLHPFAVG